MVTTGLNILNTQKIKIMEKRCIDCRGKRCSGYKRSTRSLCCIQTFTAAELQQPARRNTYNSSKTAKCGGGCCLFLPHKHTETYVCIKSLKVVAVASWEVWFWSHTFLRDSKNEFEIINKLPNNNENMHIHICSNVKDPVVSNNC